MLHCVGSYYHNTTKTVHREPTRQTTADTKNLQNWDKPRKTEQKIQFPNNLKKQQLLTAQPNPENQNNDMRTFIEEIRIMNEPYDIK